jgi:hypothetical protein
VIDWSALARAVFRACAAVYHRDQYRVSRTGKGAHFKMHYNRSRCTRRAAEGGFLCTQHAKVPNPLLYVDPASADR